MKTLQEVLDESAADAGPAMAATFAREDRRLDIEGFREFWQGTRMFAVSTVGKSGDPHIAPVHVLLQEDTRWRWRFSKTASACATCAATHASPLRAGPTTAALLSSTAPAPRSPTHAARSM